LLLKLSYSLRKKTDIFHQPVDGEHQPGSSLGTLRSPRQPPSKLVPDLHHFYPSDPSIPEETEVETETDCDASSANSYWLGYNGGGGGSSSSGGCSGSESLLTVKVDFSRVCVSGDVAWIFFGVDGV
jgi:hypothetical protein